MDLRVSLYFSEEINNILSLLVFEPRKIQSVTYSLYQLRYPRRNVDLLIKTGLQKASSEEPHNLKKCIFFNVFLTVHHSIDFSKYQLSAQFFQSSTIYIKIHCSVIYCCVV